MPPSPTSIRHRARWLLLPACVLLAAEAAVRLSGLTDFPLYVADAEIGYIPAPGQRGSFLHRHDWQFNALSMGATEFAPTAAEDILLVGDSVVLGGNTYRSVDRLGPQLAQRTGSAVWPIAAGSWALRNELSYLRQHADVVTQVDRVVFVLNSGDFGEASAWACDLTHPRSRPVSALLYVARKTLTDPSDCGSTPTELQVPSGDWASELKRWAASPAAAKVRVSVFLYPTRSDAADPVHLAQNLENHVAALRGALGPHVEIHSVGRDPRWQTRLYRDSIHPTEEGTAVLADILAAP